MGTFGTTLKDIPHFVLVRLILVFTYTRTLNDCFKGKFSKVFLTGNANGSKKLIYK